MLVEVVEVVLEFIATVAIERVKQVVTSSQSTKPTVEKTDQKISEETTIVTEQAVPTMRNAKKVAL